MSEHAWRYEDIYEGQEDPYLTEDDSDDEDSYWEEEGKKMWASLTPEERAEIVAKRKASRGRLRYRKRRWPSIKIRAKYPRVAKNPHQRYPR